MIQKLKLVSVVFLMLSFLVGLLSVLQYYRFKSLLYEVTVSRISVVTEDLTRDIERSLAFGLALNTNAQLKTMLEQMQNRHTDLLHAEIVATNDSKQSVLWGIGTLSIQRAKLIGMQQRSGKALWFDPTDKVGLVQVAVIKDSLARDAARLIMVFKNDPVEQALAQARDYVIKICSIIFVTTLLLMMIAVFYFLKRLDRLTTDARSMLNAQTPVLEHAEQSEILKLAGRVSRYFAANRESERSKAI